MSRMSFLIAAALPTERMLVDDDGELLAIFNDGVDEEAAPEKAISRANDPDEQEGSGKAPNKATDKAPAQELKGNDHEEQEGASKGSNEAPDKAAARDMKDNDHEEQDGASKGSSEAEGASKGSSEAPGKAAAREVKGNDSEEQEGVSKNSEHPNGDPGKAQILDKFELLEEFKHGKVNGGVIKGEKPVSLPNKHFVLPMISSKRHQETRTLFTGRIVTIAQSGCKRDIQSGVHIFKQAADNKKKKQYVCSVGIVTENGQHAAILYKDTQV